MVTYTNQMLSDLATMLTMVFIDCPSVKVYADLHNHQACEPPHARYCSTFCPSSDPDIVVYNSGIGLSPSFGIIKE